MKGDYILVTGLLIAALANLPEIQSQECAFYGENIKENQTNVNITETIPKDTVILSVTTSAGYLNCSDLSSSSLEFSKYIGYRHTPTATANKTLELFMAQAIGDDLDNGDLNIAEQKYALLIGQCKLYCQQTTTRLSVAVTIEPENTQTPIFSQNSAHLTLDENYPIGLDFSDLLIVNEQRLKVSDKDLPLEELTFDVSDSRFKAFPPTFRYYNDSKNHLRVEYEPRIAVNQPLNAEDSPIIFNLIAQNNQTESLFPITIDISPNDMRDPEFVWPYYTSTISNSQFTGLLTIKQGNILAFDGDRKINQTIRYEITDKGGLEVRIRNQQPGKGVPIEIELTLSVEGSATDKMRYVVIKATQVDDVNRYETVVLAVELPQTVVTTPVPTTQPTCPPCPTSSTATVPTTTTAIPCTTPTPPTCAPCSTVTTISTTCPTFDPTTECPTISTTDCSASSTEATQTTLYTSTASSTYPSSSPVTSTTTEGTTSCSCPTCPDETVTACPTTQCPTHPTECPTCPTATTLDSSSASTENPLSTVTSNPTTYSELTTESSSTCDCSTTPSTVSPSSPVTCPESTTASTSTCDCSTTPSTSCPEATPTITLPCECPTAVTCPTTSTPTPGSPTVHFDKQQYASELVENSPAQTLVVSLNAESSSMDEQPAYSFAESYDATYFSVDSKTGVVTTARSLPIGDYTLEAIAEIRSGAKDYTRIVVSSVMGTLCNGTQFSSPLYEFPVAERTTGIVGQVELRSTEDTVYDLTITSCNPPSMIGDFDVKPNGTLVVLRPFGWTATLLKITITITATGQRNVRLSPISTIVNLDVLDINEAPEFVGYGTSVVVGYPERTYFDPSVQMPLYTVKAFDPDSQENASLTYHLANEFEYFDIDVLTGSLFVRGLDSLDSTSSRTVQVLARDKHGLQDSLSITVKSLGEDFIAFMKAKSDTDVLTADTVASDLSRILGYQTVVLRIEKGPDSGASVRQLPNGYAYSITFYAVNHTAFIAREEIVKKLDQANTNGLSWTIEGSLAAPLEYEVDTLVDNLTAEMQGYEIATIVLSTLFGVTLLLIVAYIIYTRKFETKRPWSKAVHAASLEIDKKHWDQRSFAQSSGMDDEQILEPEIGSFNSSLSGLSNGGARPSPTIRFVTGKTFDNDVEQAQSPTEEEAYCPPTPLPKKSILKDSNATDKNNKQRTDGDSKLEDTSVGVKFNSTPEVIEVAATSSGPPSQGIDLSTESNDAVDDDNDLLIEEF
ncbi:uncharacterized protein LOC130687004 isoform X2 [Daphnia carinata]|uniref:uncharacterized protein LOC130687004 isoform X2 n=1 Tax=Daphnia carinata TaxID=120202 RepID=UPI00257CAF31|nr:uncharacterized protein LOC130687004 isoform X2 [Daphnia carinata]